MPGWAAGLQGRTAVVTGASRGIGRAIAGALAQAGAEVLAVARSGDALAELAAEVPGVAPWVADVGDPAFHAAVAKGFEALADVDPARFRRVDAEGAEEDVAARVMHAVEDLL